MAVKETKVTTMKENTSIRKLHSQTIKGNLPFLYLMLVFFFSFSFSVQAGNYINFSEKFPSVKYNYNCGSVGNTNPTKAQYLASATHITGFNNPNWYCAKSSTTPKLNITNSSIALDYNTAVGNKFFLTTDASPYQFFMTYLFDEPVTITENSLLTLYCKEFVDTTRDNAICFSNDDKSNRFCMTMDNTNVGGDSSCGNIFSTNSSKCLDWNDLQGNRCVKAVTGKKMNMTNMTGEYLRTASAIDKDFLSDITMIEIVGDISHNSANADSFVKIDDIILYVLNGSNTLPTANLSVNSTYTCIGLNQTFPISIPIDLDVYDAEGDTIYYGEGVGYINNTYFNDFNLVNFVGVNLADFGIIEKSFGSECGIAEGDLNLSFNTHYLFEGKDAVDETMYLLMFNGQCPLDESSKGVYQKFEGIGKALSWNGEFGYINSGESLNVSFLDSTGIVSTPNFKFNIQRNNNRYLVYSYDSDNDMTLLHNISSPYNYVRLSLSNTVNDSSNIYTTLLYSSTGISFDTYSYSSFNSNVTDFKGIYYQIQNQSKISLDYVYYTLVSYDMVFSTTEPTEITFNKPGYKHFYYFVSDSIHQPEEYVTESAWVKVEQKKYCYNQQKDEITDIVISNPLNDLVDYFNIRSQLRKVLYILYIFLTIWFTWVLYKMGGFNLPVASLISCVICFLFAYLFKEGTAIISFVIIGVLSLIFSVVQQK